MEVDLCELYESNYNIHTFSCIFYHFLLANNSTQESKGKDEENKEQDKLKSKDKAVDKQKSKKKSVDKMSKEKSVNKMSKEKSTDKMSKEKNSGKASSSKDSDSVKSKESMKTQKQNVTKSQSKAKKKLKAEDKENSPRTSTPRLPSLPGTTSSPFFGQRPLTPSTSSTLSVCLGGDSHSNASVPSLLKDVQGPLLDKRKPSKKVKDDQLSTHSNYSVLSRLSKVSRATSRAKSSLSADDAVVGSFSGSNFSIKSMPVPINKEEKDVSRTVSLEQTDSRVREWLDQIHVQEQKHHWQPEGIDTKVLEVGLSHAEVEKSSSSQKMLNQEERHKWQPPEGKSSQQSDISAARSASPDSKMLPEVSPGRRSRLSDTGSGVLSFKPDESSISELVRATRSSSMRTNEEDKKVAPRPMRLKDELSKPSVEIDHPNNWRGAPLSKPLLEMDPPNTWRSAPLPKPSLEMDSSARFTPVKTVT